jgi:Endoribonuclease GhoS
MANFVARVELHSATYADYELLHTAMSRRGFLRKITADDGRTYQLPTGTYVVMNTTSSLQNALAAANTAASETRKQSWVFVAEWSAASWMNLPTA